MSLRAERLLDLPPPLLTAIVSNLTCPRSARAITLAAESSFDKPLSTHLLAVAQAAPALAEAVADVLGGEGGVVLSSRTACPLHAWVAALAPFVKAVFVSGALLRSDAIALFRELSKDVVGVEVLGMTELAFVVLNKRTEELFTPSLVAAVERSSEFLTEIGVLATPTFSSAFANVCLPNLQVAKITQKSASDDESCSTDNPCDEAETLLACDPAKALGMMLRALDGHADRAAKKSTVRELRLLGVHQVPSSKSLESCTGLFAAVRVLKLSFEGSAGTMKRVVVRLMPRFPNLECLNWEGPIKPSHLRTIRNVCKNLNEVHLRKIQRPWYENSQEDLVELFSACGGKLRSLKVSEQLLMEEMWVLVETNPGLEMLKMEIQRSDMAGLGVLLGTQCRKLRSLTMPFEYRMEDCFEPNGWRALAEAVTSASDELCELLIQCNTPWPITESEVAAMEWCFNEIVAFLGERVRKLVFVVPIVRQDMKDSIDLLGRLMLTCGRHATGLEHLRLSVGRGCRYFKVSSVDEERETLTLLLARKREMMAALPRLPRCSFGYVDSHARDRLAKLDRENDTSLRVPLGNDGNGFVS